MRRGLGVTLAVCVVLSFTPLLYAEQIDSAKALKVKAAFVYNFAKFVRWPQRKTHEADKPFVIGVLGGGSFGHVLQKTVAGKKIGSRPIEFLQLDWSEPEDRGRLQSCHIVFIDASEAAVLKPALRLLRGHSVLVIGDTQGFARAGGAIGFLLDEGRISFEINREAADRAKLRISAKLLKLGKIVTPKKRGSG